MIRYTDDFNEPVALILQQACEMGLEGIVSKRRNAPYRSGRPTTSSRPNAAASRNSSSPATAGAARAERHESSRCKRMANFATPAGVGTGYTQKMAHDLFSGCTVAYRKAAGELPADERRKDVVWVSPELVIEAFAGMTMAGYSAGFV